MPSLFFRVRRYLLRALTPMQPIKEFMQQYFTERTELFNSWLDNRMPYRESFFSSRYLTIQNKQWSEDSARELAHPPVVVRTLTHNESAEVITSELDGDVVKRFRYTLRVSGANWQIEQIAMECDSCNRVDKGAAKNCSSCNGTGWNYLY